MVALHTIQQHLQFVARLGDDYAASIEAAIAKRTDTHVYLRAEHPAFARWHGATPVGKPPAPAAPTIRPKVAPGRVRWPLPGDVVARFIHWLGFDPPAGCGCSSFQEVMNAFGWRQCWSRRDAIVERLIGQAGKQGLRIVGVHGLIAAAARLTWWRIVSAGRQGRIEVSSTAFR